eukprot:2233706-Ditylum_brightwellii.AAC.1
MVATEALMLSHLINITESRDVATIDIPGAFMQADMDEIVHMKVEGTMVELLITLEPKLYKQYLRDKNGNPVMYVRLKKPYMGY